MTLVRTLRALLPEEVVVVGSTTDSDALALVEEVACTETMSDARAREFLTGRTLARQALRELGLPDQPLLPGPSRAPLWPSEAVGSIAHTDGLRLVVVGRREDVRGLGVDVECAEAVDAELEAMIFSPEETRRHGHVPDWRTLLFSAKESVFKCLHPATGAWLDFHQVAIVHLGDSTFTARVSTGAAEIRVGGVAARSRLHVATAVVWRGALA